MPTTFLFLFDSVPSVPPSQFFTPLFAPFATFIFLSVGCALRLQALAKRRGRVETRQCMQLVRGGRGESTQKRRKRDDFCCATAIPCEERGSGERKKKNTEKKERRECAAGTTENDTVFCAEMECFFFFFLLDAPQSADVRCLAHGEKKGKGKRGGTSTHRVECGIRFV
jgi:hypothetical protein